MAFLTTNLVQNIYDELGQTEPFFGLFRATGGSTTTFINTSFGTFENPPEQDTFKNYLAIIKRDAGGASAAPEGEWGLCSGYVAGSYTGTIAAVTSAIASGDTVMLAKQDKYPLEHVLSAINRGLESLGDIPANANTSLTTVANQTEYNIPVAVKRGLKQVWVQGRTGDSDDNQWFPVTDKRNELTSAGTASILYLPRYSAGYTIKLIYDGIHSQVASYSDVINEYIHPKVATAVSILKLLEWYNHQDANLDQQSPTLYYENQYRNEILPMALSENPIQEERKSPGFFSKGKSVSVDRPPDPIS